MIKNKQQYQITKTWIAKFKESLASLENNLDMKKNDPQGWQILRESYQSQLTNLQAEIDEYQTIIDHNINEPFLCKMSSFNELGQVLIKARIAFNLQPSDLAFLSGLNEEKVTEYEDQEYQNASFSDILAISDVLGIKPDKEILTAHFDDFYRERLITIAETAINQSLMVGSEAFTATLERIANG